MGEMLLKKRSLFVLFAVIAAFACTPLASAAPVPALTENLMNPSTRTLQVSPAKTLFVDNTNRQIQLLDLHTGKMVWTKSFEGLYDCEVLKNPTKIVVLTVK